jgi:P4 family phage/plasmid primase-like protien
LTPDTVLNPSELVRSSTTVADAHIARREWLLLDFDPVRTSGKKSDNSSDPEKAGAFAQAEECRAELAALGWPAPLVVDSGNGYHLRFRIELPNDAPALALVQGVLRSLKARYSMLDVTPSNAGRVAKLPNTWARKGEPSAERPHRLAALLSECAGAVTEAQLRAIENDHTGGTDFTEATHANVQSPADAKIAREWLLGYLEHFELAHRTEARRITGGFKVGIYCPLTDADTSPHDEGGETSTVLSIIDGRLAFKCSHNTCESQERNTAAFKAEMARRHPVPYLPEPGRDAEAVWGTERTRLPLIAHATLAAAFLEDNHDFVAVYDAPGRPIAQWVKTRWDISGDDTILQRAVADYLKKLHDRYPAPKSGPDSRMRLYDTPFLGGVVRCVKLYLPPINAAVFDRDPYLLGLPGGRVIDLRTSSIREMLRADYISQRIDVLPDADCPTTRFDRFLSEILEGKLSLINYVLHLCALCLTGEPTQNLFFLWGRGRNGKGVLLRLMCAILDKFSWGLNPSEITVSRFGDDAMKRTFSNLKGKRLVTVNESVKDNLNLTMLKLMSGGDPLSGSRMRQDAVAFKPTHKVLLPTNNKPRLEATDALIGRTRMIPFRVSFRGREDKWLEKTIQETELPGILYKLITLCPGVIANGLPYCAEVMAETDQLFAELDTTQQFRDDCLVSEQGAETTGEAMFAAVSKWAHGRGPSGGLVVSAPGGDKEVDSILQELQHQPDIKYVRVRRDSERAEGRGQGRVWAYVGVRLK